MTLTIKEPLFLGVEFSNLKKTDKKPPAISVRVNLTSDDVIYVANQHARMEVIGYEDEETGLFVTDVEGVDGPNVYNLFRLKAVTFAREKLNEKLEILSGLSAEEYDQMNYKPIEYLTNHLHQKLIDRQDLYTDLQKQVALITSRRLPRVNEYLVFADDETIDHPVTIRVPYNNPARQELSKSDAQIVDRILDVFMDTYNKRAFAWYMGAALCNLDIHDDRVSKLAIVSSSQGGSGKSTLMNAIVDALFTPHYREIKDEFDSFFYTKNQFGVSSLSSKRMSLYSEASFSNDSYRSGDDGEARHDFTGMNVSVIKSLITEGYVSSEAKYGDRAMDRLNGFHLVLTNHPPVINKEHEAMNRRILPLMIYPSRMSAKAKQLDLWGKRKFNQYIEKHRQAFANYFVHVFKQDEYAFTDTDYDHTDYVSDIEYYKQALDEENLEKERILNSLRDHGINRVLDEFASQHAVDLTMLKNDIATVTAGGGSDELRNHIRVSDGVLYIDSSKNFLIRYGNYAPSLRKKLIDLYGTPIKRFQKRMLRIKLTS